MRELELLGRGRPQTAAAGSRPAATRPGPCAPRTLPDRSRRCAPGRAAGALHPGGGVRDAHPHRSVRGWRVVRDVLPTRGSLSEVQTQVARVVQACYARCGGLPFTGHRRHQNTSVTTGKIAVVAALLRTGWKCPRGHTAGWYLPDYPEPVALDPSPATRWYAGTYSARRAVGPPRYWRPHEASVRPLPHIVPSAMSSLCHDGFVERPHEGTYSTYTE